MAQGHHASISTTNASLTYAYKSGMITARARMLISLA